MDITGKATIYSKEVARQDGTMFTTYQMSLSKKLDDGKWENAYIPCNFRKGVVVENKSQINVQKGWLDFYTNKENKKVITAFVSEFELINKPQETSAGFMEVEDSSLPF